MTRYLDAVGQLAGGIAHELNNILAVIISSTDLANDVLGADHPAEGELADVTAAAMRAARLTRQLLAFAGKELRSQKRLSLDNVVTTLQPTLSRTAEGVDIVISHTAKVGASARGEPVIEACPAQLEHVLTNLVANARDAMQDGGRITIETANVELDERAA